MTKRSQVLRVPQKKYLNDVSGGAPVLDLPHGNLIPSQTSNPTGAPDDATTSNTGIAGNTRIASNIETGGDTRIASNTGMTGNASITSTCDTFDLPHSVSPNNSPEKRKKADNAREMVADTGVTSSTSVSSTGRAGMLSGLKGRTLDVWEFFCRYVAETGSTSVRVSRRHIQKESGVGSLNTIDLAIGLLQGRGWIRVHPLPGSNEGYEYEVFPEKAEGQLTETPRLIAETLRRAALALEQKTVLSPEQLNKWSRLAHQSSRLVEEMK